MKAAVIQSNYLPWKGYFDLIHEVDCFVLYDDVQYTVRDWRNRNKIKTADGSLWLTVPVDAGARGQLVQDVTIAGDDWAANHWKSLQFHYRQAPHFERYAEFFREILVERHWQRLSELNEHLITRIAKELLGIQTPFVHSRDYAPVGRRQERLIDLLGKLGADAYLSGPSARAYVEPEGFANAGIALSYMSYDHYPDYPQFHPPFAHDVSIVDLLFQVGPEAPAYIWGGRELTTVVPSARALVKEPG